MTAQTISKDYSKEMLYVCVRTSKLNVTAQGLVKQQCTEYSVQSTEFCVSPVVTAHINCGEFGVQDNELLAQSINGKLHTNWNKDSILPSMKTNDTDRKTTETAATQLKHLLRELCYWETTTWNKRNDKAAENITTI